MAAVSFSASPPAVASPREWARDLPPPVVMMGVPFDQVTTPQALALIEEMIASRRPHMLATANVDFLAQAQLDAPLREILLNTDLVVCDGTPLVWLSKWLGDPLPERVAGSDMVPLLLTLSAAKGYRVYFLGGREDVMRKGLAIIRERWPALTIAGAYSPPFAPLEKMDHADLVRRLKAAAPDILFVAFGCPKQEKWIAMNMREANVPVSVGIGASIDFIAGVVKRAPVWMRKSGLEWIYRIIQEPKRLAGRYCGIFTSSPRACSASCGRCADGGFSKGNGARTLRAQSPSLPSPALRPPPAARRRCWSCRSVWTRCPPAKPNFGPWLNTAPTHG